MVLAGIVFEECGFYKLNVSGADDVPAMCEKSIDAVAIVSKYFAIESFFVCKLSAF